MSRSFPSLVITYLTLFEKIYILTGENLITASGSFFQSAIVLLTKENFPIVCSLSFAPYSPIMIVQTGSEVHPTSYPMGTGDSFLGGKAAEA
jgi:hypothetical protein